jgi:hypothetical protein
MATGGNIFNLFSNTRCKIMGIADITNEEKDKLRIELLTARLEGRTIERKIGGEWVTLTDPDICFVYVENFRIKEPELVYLVMERVEYEVNSSLVIAAFKDEKDAVECLRECERANTHEDVRYSKFHIEVK